MAHYVYYPTGVCSRQIDFDINGNVITNIAFTYGCNGNLKAISKILDGWTVEDIEAKVLGNLCGAKGTSCPDQLAKAVRKALDEGAGN
jgi:uncharacterized protein (TIGR03905 family)